MGSLKDKLAAAQAQKANEQKPQAQKPAPTQQRLQESFIDTDVMSLDNLVFGQPSSDNDSHLYEQYPNGQKRKIYDPEEEMKAIREGQGFTNTQSKLPKAILAEMMNNPLEMQPIDGVEEKYLSENVVNRTMDILDKIESQDRKGKVSQPINEEVVYGNQPEFGGSMQELAQLIESIVDKKFKQYGSAIINESKKSVNVAPQVALMRLGESFTFMDNENNVYECKMTYKGKGNVKKK